MVLPPLLQMEKGAGEEVKEKEQANIIIACSLTEYIFKF
jgi:hypothetical protein